MARLPEAVGPDVAARLQGLRADAGLSQSGFARVLGLSVRTLQEWEQGRKQPSGPAQKLIELVSRHPELLAELATAG